MSETTATTAPKTSDHPSYASAISAATAPGQPGVTVAEKPDIGAINLRGQPDEAGFMDAVEGALGVAPPTTPNTVAAANDIEVLWLAPTEWLVRCDLDAQKALEEKLETATADQFTAVNDVSGYYTTLTISGRNARELLTRGTPLDVHPRVFGPGKCAQTVFAQASVILIPREAATAYFQMIVRRSFADYVWRWLDSAIHCLD